MKKIISIIILSLFYSIHSYGSVDGKGIICECFDIPSKIISLYGIVDINSKDDILKAYSDLIKSWKEQNISSKVGYDTDSFLVSNIQDNVDLVKTKLTNFDLEGKPLQEWNCTYVIRQNNNQWLISLGTTDNRKTISFK